MKKQVLRSVAGLAIACFATTASADTVLSNGAVFNMDDANWSNLAPTSGVNGVISNDYINAGVSLAGRGAFSVTQTAGNGSGGQWNYHSNTEYSFNLNGGTLEITNGIFFVNGNTFNLNGGDLTSLEMRLVSGGTMNVSNGTFTASLISLRGGTFNQTGGTVTSNHGGPVFNRGAAGNTLNLLGGTINAGSGNNHSLIQHVDINTTIGGDLTANLPGAYNLFAAGLHGNSSTINFSSDWTGSLTLDPSIAWDDVFEAGDVSYNGTELGTGDFETYFVNNSGVITFVSISALPQDVDAFPETPLDITLTGIGNSLTYSIASGPSQGTLDTNSIPDVVYTPANGYAGPDSFTFTVSDGVFTSDPATISISVTNEVPVADAQSVATPVDTALGITLTGSDPDNGPSSNLTYVVTQLPSNGTLDTNSLPNVIYTPDGGYAGDDSFVFTVNDGWDVSDPATVSITVAAAADVSISAVGDGSGYDLIGTEVSSFYSTNVTKSFDVGDVDNQYGTDGYLIFGGESLNNTGEYGTPGTYVQSTPVFLDSLEADASITLTRNNASQGPLDDPTAVTNGTDFVYAGYLLNNVNVGTERQMLTFSVTDAAVTRFRLGVLGGNEQNTGLDPEGVRLSFSDGVTTEVVSSLEMLSGKDPATGIGMLFFDVEIGEGTSGTFTLYAINDANPTIAGVTFDLNLDEVTEIPDFEGEVISGGTEMMLSWMTSFGTTYGVEATPSLSIPDWQIITNGISGTDDIISIITGIGEGPEFFRPYVED